MTTTDAVIVYDVTQSLVDHGSIAMTGEVAGYEIFRGRGGRQYSGFGIGQSVWNIPFFVAGRVAARSISDSEGARRTIQKAAVALATVPAVALLAWVCFELVVALGAMPLKGLRTVALLVAGTSLWPYSGFGFNQPLAALFLWSAVLAAVSAGHSRVGLVASGLLVGLALLTRHEMVLATVLLALYVAARSRGTRVSSLAWYASGLVPMVAVWCALNWWRFGDPLESGYSRVQGQFGGSVPAGIAGLLFSPYASLILYSPIVLLSAVGFRAFWRRDRLAALLFATLFVVYFLYYSSQLNWVGGRSYGPRYLVPFLPALVLPLAFWSPAARWRRLAAAVAMVSVLVQIPGVAVDYSKVRMERAAAGETVAVDHRWKGTPLLLNARATLTSGRHAARFLAGRETRLPVNLGDTHLSSTLSFGLDLWWLHLAYLGIIGRPTALAIGFVLAMMSAAAFRLACVSAARHPGHPAG